MKWLWTAAVDGKPWTIACHASGLSIALLHHWHWAWIVLSVTLLVLNLASFDYQRRHGWPLDEDDQ